LWPKILWLLSWNVVERYHTRSSPITKMLIQISNRAHLLRRVTDSLQFFLWRFVFCWRCHFSPEDEDRLLFRNAGVYVRVCTAPKPRNHQHRHHHHHHSHEKNSNVTAWFTLLLQSTTTFLTAVLLLPELQNSEAQRQMKVYPHTRQAHYDNEKRNEFRITQLQLEATHMQCIHFKFQSQLPLCIFLRDYYLGDLLRDGLAFRYRQSGRQTRVQQLGKDEDNLDLFHNRDQHYTVSVD
jgi:hypothetical protein